MCAPGNRGHALGAFLAWGASELRSRSAGLRTIAGGLGTLPGFPSQSTLGKHVRSLAALPPTGTSGRPATRTDLAVSAAGFEPTTPGSGGRCSIQMSYAPKLRTIHSPRLARAQGPRCGARGGSSRWRIRRTASSACECYALTGRTHPRRSQGQGKLRRSGRIRREQTIWFRRNRLQSRSARRILRRATSPEQWGSTDWDCSGC